MNKITQRLLVFFIGVPLVVCIALIKFQNHLFLHFLIIVVSYLSALELNTIFSKKIAVQPKLLTGILTASVPTTGLFVSIFNLSNDWYYLTLTMSIMVALSYEIFSKDNTENFTSIIFRYFSTVFSLIYISFFISFISRLTVLEYSSIYIATFLLMVFGCDSIAWLFGITMGKNNRGLVKVSPNKSLAGFIGGFAGSIVFGIVVYMIYPHVFHNRIQNVVIIGFFVAISAILGDLVESCIKRSVDCKDSGTIIPGRGGLLDSIDSILFSAPTFTLLLNFLL
jgi:phosphatidate cytidylyltransferase